MSRALKKKSTAEFNTVPLDTFDDGFVQLCRKRVAVNGDYLEETQKQFHRVSILSDGVPEL